jgi:hypothetical protein
MSAYHWTACGTGFDALCDKGRNIRHIRFPRGP